MISDLGKLEFHLPSGKILSANQIAKLPFVHISDKGIRARVQAHPNMTLAELIAPAIKTPPKPGRGHPWFKEKKAAAEV